jgi:hypothetical protein
MVEVVEVGTMGRRLHRCIIGELSTEQMRKANELEFTVS